MQIEMTIDAKRSQVSPLMSESGVSAGTPLMMDLESPCPAAIGTPPAIPFQVLAAAQNCTDVAAQNCTLDDFVAARRGA